MDGLALFNTIAQWTATALIAAGLLYTTRVNSNHRQVLDTKTKSDLQKDIEGIKERLDDPKEGLAAIRREITTLKVNLARRGLNNEEGERQHD